MNVNEIVQKVHKLNNGILDSGLDSLGFGTEMELFSDELFVENYISNLLQASRPPNRISPFDCVLKDGSRIEIKHSNLVYDSVDSINPRAYFRWVGLRGTNNKKDNMVDYFILSGYISPLVANKFRQIKISYEEPFWFWVFPYKYALENLKKKGGVEFKISERKVKAWHWINSFFVGQGELKLINYFHEGKHNSLIQN